VLVMRLLSLGPTPLIMVYSQVGDAIDVSQG